MCLYHHDNTHKNTTESLSSSSRALQITQWKMHVLYHPISIFLCWLKKDMHYHTKRKAHESLIMQLYQLYKCKLSLKTTRNIRFKIPAFDVQNSNPITTLYYFAFQDDYSFLDDQRNFLNIYLDILLCVIGSLFPAIPWNTHLCKNPQFVQKFTFWNSHFSQNSHFQNLIFHKIHIFKVQFFTKFTISKSNFSQNSHFQSLIFHKIHIFQTSNSWAFLDKKLVFGPSV